MTANEVKEYRKRTPKHNPDDLQDYEWTIGGDTWKAVQYAYPRRGYLMDGPGFGFYSCVGNLGDAEALIANTISKAERGIVVND